eukprot:30772-Pelagococcus_subviridis.AAC.1
MCARHDSSTPSGTSFAPKPAPARAPAPPCLMIVVSWKQCLSAARVASAASRAAAATRTPAPASPPSRIPGCPKNSPRSLTVVL